jgi:nucleoside-diphosphate-sugar epimerase
MRALVTGSTGCLGRNLVERLVADGHEVVATGRNLVVGERLRVLGARFVAADISDAGTLTHAAKGCDAIFHCAALASPWGKYEDFYQANVTGTKSAITAALKAKAILVHVSTPSIYFNFRDRFEIDEYDRLPEKQVNDYATTKLEAERHIDEAVGKHGLCAVTLRPRAIFGPYDTALFPRVLAACRNGRVPLVGNGHTVIDVSCVSNVVDAMLLAVERAETVCGKKYNITNGTPVLLRDLISMVFEEIGLEFRPRSIPYSLAYGASCIMEGWAASRFGKGEPKLTRYSAGILKFHQTLSIKRAREELGYAPRKPTDMGVVEYAKWRRSGEA